MEPACQARLFTGLALITDVELAGRIIADKDRGESRARAMFSAKFLGLLGDLRLHRLRQLFSVQENRGHVLLLSWLDLPALKRKCAA